MTPTEQMVKEAQNTIDQLRTFPQYKRYVDQAKLSLIDSRLEYIDRLLVTGVLK